MNIEQIMEGKILTLKFEGRLDSATAPRLEELIDSITDAEKLVMDFADLYYVSSAGLRVILKAYKFMSDKQGLVVKNVNEIVMEIFDITGFVDFLNIE